jgi:excisionase family DNA binding protein
MDATSVGRALLDSLDPDDLAEFASRLAPYLPHPIQEDEWMSVGETTKYLGLSSRYALYRLKDHHGLPFHQHGPNGRIWFRRSEVDRWQESATSKQGVVTHLRGRRQRLS